jgi:hypothetical protein
MTTNGQILNKARGGSKNTRIPMTDAKIRKTQTAGLGAEKRREVYDPGPNKAKEGPGGRDLLIAVMRRTYEM